MTSERFIDAALQTMVALSYLSVGLLIAVVTIGTAIVLLTH